MPPYCGSCSPRCSPSAGTRSCAAVADADALRAAVAEHRPDVTVVDIRMPPTHTDEGLRAAIDIRREHPGTGVLLFSQYIETKYAAQLLAARLGGRRLPAQGPGGERRRVHRGAGPGRRGRHRARPRGRHPAGRAAAGGTDGVGSLTAREREVLALMAEGRSERGHRAGAVRVRRARWRSTSRASSASSACPRRRSQPAGARGPALPGSVKGPTRTSLWLRPQGLPTATDRTAAPTLMVGRNDQPHRGHHEDRRFTPLTCGFGAPGRTRTCNLRIRSYRRYFSLICSSGVTAVQRACEGHPCRLH